MEDRIFESELNNISNIHAVFEDDGMTGWAYLYDENTGRIIADCWIYNVPDTNNLPQTERKDSPPILPKELLVDEPILFDEVKSVSFKWSDDGCSVYIIINGIVIAHIDPRSSKSQNVNIKTPCPWGEPLKL